MNSKTANPGSFNGFCLKGIKEKVPMKPKFKILIVEDNQLFREGLKSLLASNTEYECIGMARDGLEALQLIRKNEPDFVLMDLSMPKLDGISVMREIKTMYPETKILALTIHESDEFVLQAFNAGANGYCIKDSSRRDLLTAIQTVLDGKSYISPQLADQVMEGYLESSKRLKSKTDWETITEREKEVLTLVVEGYKNRQIAERLLISIKTVEKHRANIMKKLDLHSASELTAYALGKNLIAGIQS
jgi:DNA-binding NarL/FixJ family response regulator